MHGKQLHTIPVGIKEDESIDSATKARHAYAEYLPITEMMARGYFGCLAPTNFPHIDSWSFKLDDQGKTVSTVRFQSKYTANTKTTQIPLKHLNFDFLVIVRDTQKNVGASGRFDAEVFVVPLDEVIANWNSAAQTYTISKKSKHLAAKTGDKDVWQQVVQFLENPSHFTNHQE